MLRARGSSADVELVGVIPGELGVLHHRGRHSERLERGEQLLGLVPVRVGFGLPDRQHVQSVVVRADRLGKKALHLLGRADLLGDPAEAFDRLPVRGGHDDVSHRLSCLSSGDYLVGQTLRTSRDRAIVRTTHRGTHSPGGLGSAAEALDQAAIWLRLLKPSLVRMCWTWFCAVRSERYSAAAICLFVRPCPTSLATSRSRGLSTGGAGSMSDRRL